MYHLLLRIIPLSVQDLQGMAITRYYAKRLKISVRKALKDLHITLSVMPTLPYMVRFLEMMGFY